MNEVAEAGGRVSVEMVTAIVDAFNRHDVDAIMNYCADDIVWVMARGPHPWGRKYEGAAEVRQALVERFKSIPDAQWRDGTDYVLGDVGVPNGPWWARQPRVRSSSSGVAICGSSATAR